MKRIQLYYGGHSLRADDLIVLVDGMIDVFNGICKGLGLGNTSYVLQGCDIATGGGNHVITAGYIYHNGEVYPVDGHTIVDAMLTKYWVVQTDIIAPSPVTYADATVHNVHYRNKMVLVDQGTPPVGIYTTVSGCRPLASKIGLTPVNGIIMYSGSVGDFDGSGKGKENTKVEGWALCNGSNGTPNLKGRFIVGYDPGPGDYDAIGKNGGSETKNLSHRHKILTTIDDGSGGFQYWFWKNATLGDTVKSKLFTIANNVSLTGGTQMGLSTFGGFYQDFHSDNPESGVTSADLSAQNIRPPYYTLAYIMKIA